MGRRKKQGVEGLRSSPDQSVDDQGEDVPEDAVDDQGEDVPEDAPIVSDCELLPNERVVEVRGRKLVEIRTPDGTTYHKMRKWKNENGDICEELVVL